MGKLYKNHQKGYFNFFNMLVYLVVLFSCLSIFQYYFSVYIGGAGLYVLLFVLVFIALINFINVNLTKLQLKQIISFSIWSIIYIIVNQFFLNYRYANVVLGIDLNIFTLQTIQVICLYVVYVFLNINGNEIVKANIIKMIFIALIIDAIITLRSLGIDPNISRIMATGREELNIYGLKGVSGYSIIYSIVIIFPLLIYSLGELKYKYRIVMGIFTILMLVFLYFAAYTTALIAIIIGLLVYLFLITSKVFKIFILPLLFTLGALLINPYYIYSILKTLSVIINIQAVSVRFSQLADFIFYGDTTGAGINRLLFYKKSIDAFLKYPLTGITIFDPNYDLSGHSAFLDILGGTGLIGFIPYILFIWYSYKISIRNVENKNCINAISTCYIVFCFIGFTNTLATSITIMLFLLFFITWYPIFILKYSLKRRC